MSWQVYLSSKQKLYWQDTLDSTDLLENLYNVKFTQSILACGLPFQDTWINLDSYFQPNQMTMQKTCKVTFSLPAEILSDASSGLLLGEFNNWNKEQGFNLKKSKDGSMKTTVELEAGKSYEYRYLLDGGRWVNDQIATAYTEVHGLGVLNCVVSVPTEVAAETKPAKKTTEKKPKAEKSVSVDNADVKPGAKRTTAKKTSK